MENLRKWYNLFMSEDQKPEDFKPLRSITRLLVGGILLGSDTFKGQLQDWENLPEEGDSLVFEGEVPTQSVVNPLPDTLPPPQVGQPLKKGTVDVRYALIGLIFEGEENLEKGLSAAKQVGNFALRVTNPLFRPLQKLRMLNPAKNRFERMAQRGQTEIDRWVVRGREEETNSRDLVQQATTSTVDQSILYIAENEAITELIQTQGLSLAEQILELVRAILISTDYFLEGLVFYVLRRRPRYLLPDPSQDVQAQTTWTIQDIRQEVL